MLGSRSLGVVVGSSPRVRGKPLQTEDKVDAHRIIPASAGQTTVFPIAPAGRTDHPRECGANAMCSVTKRCRLGSSPRVRGKLRRGERARVCVRIIPASAGQTRLMTCTSSMEQDHPRECGANLGCIFCTSVSVGSSPRVRGKLSGLTAEEAAKRIIPASAGQTRLPESS